MLNFCDLIQIYIFTTNHHLKAVLFRNDNILESVHEINLHRVSNNSVDYDGPNGSLFISIPLNNSEFRNLHYEFRNSEL